jgi:hypothetical protein
MINYQPFIDEDIDLTEAEDVTAWRLGLEPHASVLGSYYSDLLEKHALLHAMGMEAGPLHDVCIRALAQTEADLYRMKAALHN